MPETLNKKLLLLRSLAIAGGLTIFKLVVFFMTNSMSILASATDSFMDFVVSAANFLFVRAAAKPADHDHPYGHGKIESLAGFIQSVVVGGASLGIGGMAIHRLFHPEDIRQPVAGIVIIVVALLLNIWHSRNLKASMISTNSQLMATEYMHYATDTLVYLGVLVSLVLFKVTGSAIWDPVISLLIVLYLLKSVGSIFRQSLGELLDEQLSDAHLHDIDQAIRNFSPQVVDYHDLRTRKVGNTKFIEFHVVLRDVEKFNEAHELTEGLMDIFKEKYPGAIVTVHPDPEGGI